LGLVRIGELAAQYGITSRSLRYWEDVGIVKSCRTDKGYRYFDDAGVRRIEHIILLRKLRMSIQDIQTVFTSDSLDHVIGVLQKHLERTSHEAEELTALNSVLDRLIKTAKAKSNSSETPMPPDTPTSSTAFESEDTLTTILSECYSCMSENPGYSTVNDVRIVRLPKMVFACYRTESATPENDCSKIVNEFVMGHSLHLRCGFRSFGFNNPEPREGNPVYGYEMWVVVPEDFNVREPFYRKEFSGGLFASIPARVSSIGERWNLLWDWVFSSETYEIDWDPRLDRRWLEECIDYEAFSSDEAGDKDLQLDLLAPIKQRAKG